MGSTSGNDGTVVLETDTCVPIQWLAVKRLFIIIIIIILFYF